MLGHNSLTRAYRADFRELNAVGVLHRHLAGIQPTLVMHVTFPQ